MARKSTARTPEQLDAPGNTIDHQALADAGAALAERGQQLAIVEQQYGIDMPYNLEVFKARIRLSAAESAARLIEVGLMLIQIKEHEPHGSWLDILDEIGLGRRFAQRCMQAAAKLRDMPRITSLGTSKALELLSEDDDQLAELEAGGTLAGKTFDELDCMTTRELRALLREERQERAEEKAADEEIIAAKEQRIQKLTRDKRKAGSEQQLREQAEELLRDIDEAAVEATSAMARMKQLVGEIRMLYGNEGLAVDADIEERLEANAEWAQGRLHELADVSGE